MAAPISWHSIEDNVQVFNTHITVTGGEGSGTVLLNRGSERITLNCTGGHCEQTPMPGDDQKTYDTTQARLIRIRARRAIWQPPTPRRITTEPPNALSPRPQA